MSSKVYTLLSQDLINHLCNLIEMLVLSVAQTKHSILEILQPFFLLFPLKIHFVVRPLN